MANNGSDLDWRCCDLVEQVPGKVSGRPLVRGTRILADITVQDASLVRHMKKSRRIIPTFPWIPFSG